MESARTAADSIHWEHAQPRSGAYAYGRFSYQDPGFVEFDSRLILRGVSDEVLENYIIHVFIHLLRVKLSNVTGIQQKANLETVSVWKLVYENWPCGPFLYKDLI